MRLLALALLLSFAQAAGASWERLLARVPGEIPDARTFLALGEWVVSGAHAAQSFDQFRAARGLDASPLKLNVFKP